MTMSDQLIYVADPMCSWCWGFSPVIESVREKFGDAFDTRLILGGLRPGTTKPMDDKSKQTIRDHWEHVETASGQPFDFAFFERNDFVYDTEPACRAVVAARRQDEDKAFAYLKRVHRAFYAENRDVTERGELVSVAEDAGLDRGAFEASFDAEDVRTETWNDFGLSQRSGITGFPTLLIGNRSDGHAVVTVGFQPWEAIEARIETWRAQRAGAAAQV